jgi:hypothetical protein
MTKEIRAWQLKVGNKIIGVGEVKEVREGKQYILLDLISPFTGIKEMQIRRNEWVTIHVERKKEHPDSGRKLF